MTKMCKLSEVREFLENESNYLVDSREVLGGVKRINDHLIEPLKGPLTNSIVLIVHQISDCYRHHSKLF